MCIYLISLCDVALAASVNGAANDSQAIRLLHRNIEKQLQQLLFLIKLYKLNTNSTSLIVNVIVIAAWIFVLTWKTDINSWTVFLECLGSRKIYINVAKTESKYNQGKQWTFHSKKFRECCWNAVVVFRSNARNLKNFTVDQQACKPNGFIRFECNWVLLFSIFFLFRRFCCYGKISVRGFH